MIPPTPEDARAIREFFAAAGYTEEGYRARPMLRELPLARTGNLDYLLEATRDPSPFNVIVRLFLFGSAVDLAIAGGAVPETVLQALIDSGMARVETERLIASVMAVPVEQYIVVSDPLRRMESGEISDLVLWPNPTSRILQYLAIPRPCDSLLDFGAGCGVISLLTAKVARTVSATDLNPRAAEFVLFNAALNQISNIETVTGDTFERFRGRKFDRILANPPFFVGPSTGVMYCENPLELDDYCRRVVRESAEHLNEGAYFQMVFEWVQVKGQRWQERLAEWLEGTGCDAWILRTYAGDAAAYAHERTRDHYGISASKAGEKYAHWMSYLRERGVEEVHGGVFSMRRRSAGGPNWLRIEEGRIDATGPFGDAVLSLFETQTLLSQAASNEALLALRPKLAAGARLTQQFSAEGAAWAPASLTVTLPGPLPASMGIEWQVANFAARCDGLRTLEQLAGELAGLVNAPPEQVREQCCAVVRKLAERRFLDLYLSDSA